MIDISQKFDIDSILFAYEWLELPTKKDCQLKILLLASILGENHLGFRGTLATMREWLGIKQSYAINKQLEEAIDKLKEKEYILAEKEGRIYHISITNKGLKNKEIVKIRRQWITTFQNYKENINDISIDWLHLLRVFVFLYGRKEQNIVTMQTIAKNLNISIETTRKALKVIEQCDLKGIKFIKNTIKQEVRDAEGKAKTYRNIGTDIGIFILFEDK